MKNPEYETEIMNAYIGDRLKNIPLSEHENMRIGLSKTIGFSIFKLKYIIEKNYLSWLN